MYRWPELLDGSTSRVVKPEVNGGPIAPRQQPRRLRQQECWHCRRVDQVERYYLHWTCLLCEIMKETAFWSRNISQWESIWQTFMVLSFCMCAAYRVILLKKMFFARAQTSIICEWQFPNASLSRLSASLNTSFVWHWVCHIQWNKFAAMSSINHFHCYNRCR